LWRWQQDPSAIIRPLIAINVIFYIVSLLLGPLNLSGFHNPLSFLAPSNHGLLLLGATGALPVLQLGRWWSLVAASFLHGSLLHLLFNMVALSQLGPFAASLFGVYRFLLIYIVSGIVGFYLSALAGVMLTIGASAALCGLIGALLYYGLRRGGDFGRLVVSQVRGWVVGLILIGLFLPSINNWGHGGGLAAGFALAALLGYRERSAEGPLLRAGGIAVLLLTLTILVWALGQSLFYFFQ
jgi:rhomboid protease GluP